MLVALLYPTTDSQCPPSWIQDYFLFYCALIAIYSNPHHFRVSTAMYCLFSYSKSWTISLISTKFGWMQSIPVYSCPPPKPKRGVLKLSQIFDKTIILWHIYHSKCHFTWVNDLCAKFQGMDSPGSCIEVHGS